MIKDVVASSKKLRFTLKQSGDETWIIRANQGHSIPHIDLVELFEDEILNTDPNFEYVHGTFFKNVPGICERGLLSGGVEGLKGRQIIHAVKVPKGLPKGHRAAGLRPKCEVLVYIDVAEVMKNGIRFFHAQRVNSFSRN